MAIIDGGSEALWPHGLAERSRQRAKTHLDVTAAQAKLAMTSNRPRISQAC